MSDQYSHGGDTACFLLMDKPDFHMCENVWPPQQDFNAPRWYPIPATTAVKEPNPEPPLSMAEAWQRWLDDQTLQTADERAAEGARNYQRLLNLEAGAKLSLAIGTDEAEAIREEIETWQKLD